MLAASVFLRFWPPFVEIVTSVAVAVAAVDVDVVVVTRDVDEEPELVVDEEPEFVDVDPDPGPIVIGWVDTTKLSYHTVPAAWLIEGSLPVICG